MAQIEISATEVRCEVEIIETVTRNHLTSFDTTFVPAVGDEVEIKRKKPSDFPGYPDQDRYDIVRVLGRSWDMTDAEKPRVTLTVERVID